MLGVSILKIFLPGLHCVRNFIMTITHCKHKEIILVCAVLFNFVITNAYNAPDLRGSYCASRRNGCCRGRQDECSAPIKDTLCYCDDFCNRTRNDDCCPDFLPYCKGILETPPENITRVCRSRLGEIHQDGEIVKNNCNECKCQEIKGEMELMCESHQCLIDEQLVGEINSRSRFYGWRASNYSEFWGRRYEEGLTLRLGLMHSRKKVMQMQPLKHPVNVRELPRSFDARANWPGRISLPRDQGWCGASWVFSTVSVVSDRLAIMTRGNDHTILSPQHLLSCNSRNQRGCQGGHLTRAWTFIRYYGLVSDECYPWEGSLSECRVNRHKKPMDAPCPGSYGVERAELHRVGPVYRLGTEEDVMYEILHSGPVQAVIRISRDFFSYNSGIYRCTRISANSDRLGHHAVRIVGWGEEVLNNEMVKYWIVSNSWGTWWGENGFFRIRRGSNECEIEDFILAAWVKIDKVNTIYNTVKFSKNSIIPI